MALVPPCGVPPVRPVTLDAGGIPLSGLLALPAQPVPRAVLVALHGSGMSAGYFDSRARPGLSLLELAAAQGYAVLALDRPGYGASAAALPEGQDLAGQTATLLAALEGFVRGRELGAGLFLVAHSGGGRIALAAAAAARGPLVPLGVDLSGLGRRWAVRPWQPDGPDLPGSWRRYWGALRFYPPGAFRLGQDLLRPVPAVEARETLWWPEMYPAVAAGVGVPVRFTFAEQEQWWRHDGEALEELLTPLTGASTEVARQAHAGHNISLGWAARTYHLRVLSFLEECLLARDTAVGRVATGSDRDLKKVDADLT
ncbi:alpha/beta hydrolase [Streptomyces sp. NBC_00091]|uniref:alpha/beta hydrolase n=1 Tax=Streptomyces sp. NBC_00091 TaxID=2975648 RepID=UPI00225ADAF1|nr:alpha/beta fold hydrolase [Streptomyces sp. NBC_00091]MCX5381202.1 alpha/beta fold hydrolase [Streptomyces sp. NBC_00091]